jgi:membrane protein required for colicin V production
MIRCYLKGFLSELLSMAAILFGLLAAIYLYKNGGEFLRNHFWQNVKIFPEVVAFIALFALVFLAVKLLEVVLKDIIYKVSLGGADRFLGIVFGLLEGIAVVSLILFLLRVQPLFDPGAIFAESFFANLLLPLILSPQTESMAGV